MMSGVGADFRVDDTSDTLDNWSETEEARSESSCDPPLTTTTTTGVAGGNLSEVSTCSSSAGGGTGAFLFLKTEASEAFDVLDTFLKITRQANPIISQIQFHSSLICVRHTKFVVQLSLLLVSSLRTNCQEW
jgi:hypothetical protein